jgi:hypothetical protein
LHSFQVPETSQDVYHLWLLSTQCCSTPSHCGNWKGLHIFSSVF